MLVNAGENEPYTSVWRTRCWGGRLDWPAGAPVWSASLADTVDSQLQVTREFVNFDSKPIHDLDFDAGPPKKKLEVLVES